MSQERARPSEWPAARARGSHPLPERESEFRRELERRLALLRREITSLKVRAQSIAGVSGEEYLELGEALERNADRLERRVAMYAGDGAVPWERFRNSTEADWRDLKQTLLRVATSLRQRYPDRFDPLERPTQR
jgi:hypothetical protein